MFVGGELDRRGAEPLGSSGSGIERRQGEDFRSRQSSGKRGHAALPCSRRSAASAWASRPSRRASRAACRATSNAASASTCRSEEHTSELQSLMRSSYAVFCLKKNSIYINEKYRISQRRD